MPTNHRKFQAAAKDLATSPCGSSERATPVLAVELNVHVGENMSAEVWNRVDHFLRTANHPARRLAWLSVLRQTFGYRTWVLEATRATRTVGVLPLAEVNSLMFGKYLVSLPYLNQGGVWTNDRAVAEQLVDSAIQLADHLKVRHLELRNEAGLSHAGLSQSLTSKVHMRLTLPSSSDALDAQFKSKLRSQIRSGARHGFSIHWGQNDLLEDFYQVFSRNMRDLGTPVYPLSLFVAILNAFPNEAELCCLRSAGRPIAGALLIHASEVTEVPSASTLRAFHSANANMLMYWNLLQRAIARGSRTFDFGRSTLGSPTYRFKRQWGAIPTPATWQYFVRQGAWDALRPENARFAAAIQVWKRLPVRLTQYLGPLIVRGIP